MKINVITVNLICHIPIDRDDRRAVDAAYKLADSLCEKGDEIGETVAYHARLDRVMAPVPTAPEPKPKLAVPEAPKPEPPKDDLDIPENLSRTPKPTAAE